jgi:hypothetical protein
MHGLGQRHRLGRQCELPGLDRGEIEDFVDEFEQVPAGMQDLK